MAPTIPIDFKGQRESKKYSKAVSGDVMGKTNKISKGYSAGHVPDYPYAVETVAESEGFGSSDRVDAVLTASRDSCAPTRKYISLNADGSVVPIQLLSLSKMSHVERRDLGVRLKIELEQVRKLQRKIASFSSNALARSTHDVHSFQNGPKRPDMMEALSMPSSNVHLEPGKKKLPSGKNGSRTKGGAVAVRRDELIKQSHPQSTNFVMLMKQCETLLTRLMVHQHAWIFNEPVDIVKHKIPDYYTIIKNPMDLGTVKSKLLSNKYSHPMEYAADVRLTFINAMTYNPPGHDVHYMAEVMSKYFEVRWKPIERKIPPISDEFAASKSSIIVEPESAYVPPAKKQKSTSVEYKAKSERDKRVMSDAEKQKLGIELESLLAELPDNIINFMKESTLNGNQVSEDEIEIDIDSLSDDTLYTLRKLLDDFLLEKQRQKATFQPSEIEMRKESGFSNLSGQPCKDSKPADDDVVFGGNDLPPISSSPMNTDKDPAPRNSNGNQSSSSDSGSSSSDTDSVSSASKTDGAKDSVPPITVNETVDNRAEQKESELGDTNNGEVLSGHADLKSVLNSSSTEHSCHQQGESAQPERQVSPEKLYRAALLRSRFADIIIKAQENTLDKGEKPDPEKLRLEREELERRRKEEKARLQAEAQAAEEARMKAEAEAATEARRKRELEREAARQALQKMEKTVDINEGSQFMEDLEMFRSVPDEHLQGLTEEAIPESSQNGLGSFKFRASSNPLERLGLYMKNDEDEEEVEPESILETSNDPE